MRRSVAVVSLLTLGWLAVPALPASACSLPAPTFEAGSDSVAQGGSLHVEGEGRTTGDCVTPTGSAEPSETVTETPEPSETVEPTETPSETAEPTETPSETAGPTETPQPSETTTTPAAPPTTTTPPAFPGLEAPAFRPMAAMRAAQQKQVVFSLTREGTTVAQPIDTLPEEHTTDGGTDRYTFSGTITVPASVAPGRYVLEARGSVAYGDEPLVVGRALPETGAGDTASLLKVALMFGVTGVVAVAGGVAMARRS